MSVITYVCFWVAAHSLKSFASFEALPGLQTKMSWTMIIRISILPACVRLLKLCSLMVPPGSRLTAMRRTAFLLVLVAIAALAGGHVAGQDAASSAADESTRKPWARWWWPGS